jgi:predicted RNA-binding protein with PUA-like domain
MTAWIFQSKPQQYDLRTELQVGQVERWMATRYRSEMRDGDTVLFWLAGSPDIRGIYGRGRIVGEPFPDPDDGGPVINVRVEEKYRAPLSVSQIRADQKLRELDILRVPIGTNFRLTKDELAALERHLSGSGR